MFAARVYLLVCLAVVVLQRKLLYFPSHEDSKELARSFNLKEWTIDGVNIGFRDEVQGAKRIWLFVHGNGGQAVYRGYARNCLSERDSLFILEYPGYGSRPGSPSQAVFNEAAVVAYQSLKAAHPDAEINVMGESLGSGPSCHLATLADPPKRIVLLVPFDRIIEVAKEKFPFLPIGLMMFDRWDNIEALKAYKGRVDIYGAKDDAIIPVAHAKKLAAALPGSVFHEIEGGHEDWPDARRVDLR
jgi:pimeloyl-ACP methyl ester carboxylesterase